MPPEYQLHRKYSVEVYHDMYEMYNTIYSNLEDLYDLCLSNYYELSWQFYQIETGKTVLIQAFILGYHGTKSFDFLVDSGVIPVLHYFYGLRE